MLKQDINYNDFEDQPRTTTAYFNLTKAEVAEMELSETNLDADGKPVEGNGMIERLTAVTKSGNGKKIMETFKWFISKSYGIRSEDGEAFMKSEEISERFLASAAYSEFFMSLITDPDAAADFVNNIFPKELVDAAAKKQAETRTDGRPALQDHLPKKPVEPKLVESPKNSLEELRVVQPTPATDTTPPQPAPGQYARMEDDPEYQQYLRDREAAKHQQ